MYTFMWYKHWLMAMDEIAIFLWCFFLHFFNNDDVVTASGIVCPTALIYNSSKQQGKKHLEIQQVY